MLSNRSLQNLVSYDDLFDFFLFLRRVHSMNLILYPGKRSEEEVQKLEP